MVPVVHDDELAIDLHLVRRLVDQSFPQYADLGLAPLTASGSSNAMFRLGKELLVRLPRQAGGSASIEKEARWLPTISAGLSVPVPDVVGVGAAGFGSSETWSVVRWINGQSPAVPWSPSASGPSRGLALELALVITQLHRIKVPCAAQDDPALEWYRGGTLSDIDEDFRGWVECRWPRRLPGCARGGRGHAPALDGVGAGHRHDDVPLLLARVAGPLR